MDEDADDYIIPASHDWWLLSYDNGRARRSAVVAWRIVGTTAEPITVDPAVDVLCPDGSVTGTFGQFRSQDLWQEAQAQAQDPAGWADPPPAAAAASDARMAGAAPLRPRPKSFGETKNEGLQRRRRERRQRARVKKFAAIRLLRLSAQILFTAMDWNGRQTAELIRLTSGSMSVDQIAAALSITRGAVVGKVKRLRAAGKLPPTAAATIAARCTTSTTTSTATCCAAPTTACRLARRRVA